MKRAAIVEAARAWVGTPYRHRASLRGVGCDCLGLVRGVWRDVVGPEPEALPAYTPDWAEARAAETLRDTLLRHFIRKRGPLPPPDGLSAGTLLLFRWKAGAPAKHCGIAVGGARLVHAYDAAGRAVEGALCPVWSCRLVAAFDFPGVSD